LITLCECGDRNIEVVSAKLVGDDNIIESVAFEGLRVVFEATVAATQNKSRVVFHDRGAIFLFQYQHRLLDLRAKTIKRRSQGKKTVSDPSQHIDQSDLFSARMISMPVGIIVSKYPGVTRWASEIWKPSGLIPGADIAHWVELRSEGDVTQYHARTLSLTLYRSDVEAYRVALSMEIPSAFVILDEDESGESPGGWQVTDVTLSPYEAQDLLDSGFSLVEAVPIPSIIASWAQQFVDHHFVDEPFKKRKRDRLEIDQIDEGIGDPRVSQINDVYMSPASLRKRKKH